MNTGEMTGLIHRLNQEIPRTKFASKNRIGPLYSILQKQTQVVLPDDEKKKKKYSNTSIRALLHKNKYANIKSLSSSSLILLLF